MQVNGVVGRARVVGDFPREVMAEMPTDDVVGSATAEIAVANFGT